MKDTFSVRDTLEVNGQRHVFASLAKLGQRFDLKRLPYSMKILLENLLRHEDGVDVTAKDIEAVAKWDAKAEPATEIAFMPARVVLQDFTGVPCVVDLAAMRDAVVKLGGDATQDQPAGAGGTGHRPLRAGRRVRHGRARCEQQRRDRVRAQPASATRSCAGARRRSTTSRWCRRAPASCTR